MTTNPHINEVVRYIRREGDGELIVVVRSGNLYAGFKEDLNHRIDITQEEVREAYPNLSDNESMILISSLHGDPTRGVWVRAGSTQVPSKPTRLIGMIHPDHYRAAGRLPQLISELLHQITVVGPARSDEALKRLYADGFEEMSARVLEIMSKKYALEASDEEIHAGTSDDQYRTPQSVRDAMRERYEVEANAWDSHLKSAIKSDLPDAEPHQSNFAGSRAMLSDSERSVHIEKIRSGELSVAIDGYDPRLTTAANPITIIEETDPILSMPLGEFVNPQLKEKSMNLLIIGHQGHGKTDVGKKLAELLKTTAHDSSWFMCERVISPALKDKYDYASVAECHSDRGYHRQEWFELIEAYNDEPDRLTRAILDEGTIYVGMRSRMEFEGSKHHFDAIVWVDASERIADEPSTSMKLTRDDADYVLDNNGPIENLPRQIGNLLLWLTKRDASEDNTALLDVIKAAFQQVKGSICRCTWNPDEHAHDCPVAILEDAIYHNHLHHPKE